jgi:crotonobetainyl-CoA:carnitine CoA-transferase CaiB-like acyl-CoA transferase
MLLADLGADVIKIERPGHGDETRDWGPPYIDGTSAYFHAVNRGKRSITLDLTTEFGHEAVKRMAESADIVMENFRPGVPEHLGIDYGSLAAINPNLVYATITGFGSTGPMASTPGTEVVVEAYSGLMDITGEPDRAPVRFGVAMVDLATGMAAAAGILAALLERAGTGRGRYLEFSLYATALSCLGTVITSSSADDRNQPVTRWGTSHPSIVPYAAFPASDGMAVVGAINDPMWRRLCEALGLDHAAANPGWSTNGLRVEDRARVEEALVRGLAGLTVAEVVERLEAHQVLVAPVKTVQEAFESEHAQATGNVFDCRGTVFARSVLDTGGESLGLAPSLGGDTNELLAEFDLEPSREPRS